MNYDKKFVKIKSTVEQWNKRNLTPIGKVTFNKIKYYITAKSFIYLFANPRNELFEESK